MPVGSAESSEARIAIELVGRIANPAVLIARNRTIALVAVPFVVFRRSSSSIALIPNGVAAFPSPRKLQDTFMIIALIAGWSSGTPGNSRRVTGAIARAM